MRQTRSACEETLMSGVVHRSKNLLKHGVTTCEVKSGYGLSLEHELKMLTAINKAQPFTPLELIPTCLAAHIVPDEFSNATDYLKMVVSDLLPEILQKKLSARVDIFVEEGAFSIEESRDYLLQAKAMGFDITLHADQFSQGGALLASELGAISADHLEVSDTADYQALKQGSVIPVILPGASLGLGLPFAKAREALDLGLPVAIASDWNPGSAPMGNLLLQASLLSVYEKLNMLETLAGITYRAAAALGLEDRGRIKKGLRADLVAFPCSDYREILYRQGQILPHMTVVKGKVIQHHD